VVNNLEIDCGVVKTTPGLKDLDEGSDGKLSILLTTSGDEELIGRALSVDDVEITEISELAFEEIQSGREDEAAESPDSAAAILQVDAKAQEAVMLFADELTYLTAELQRLTGELRQPSDDLRTVSRSLSAYAAALKSRVDHTARVQLLDAVRELRDRAVAHAAEQGKRIRFLVSGGGAIVFSAVCDTITDALLHLVRNSIDHGIETIGQRARKGKAPAGTIQISVDRMGDSVRIRVSDDGIGIDEDHLRKATGDAERSILDILATPGFTMRSQVDQSSGRGVGLDTVVHAVRNLLSGGIELRSTSGKGTVVNMSIPTASRLVEITVVDTAEGAVALPSALIVEDVPLVSRRFKRDSFGARYYDYKGRSLPLLTVFGRDPSDESIAQGAVGMVVRSGGHHSVLLASRIVSTEAAVRDGIRRRKVYSKVLGKEIPFILPPSFS
jgi:chemotaxis protein histidine kinase CheA